MAAYTSQIWETRYFWGNLVLSDLRSRWRGSSLGVLWSVLQPLAFTALISIVFSKLLGADLQTFVPYVLSGVLFWECFTFSCSNGALAHIQAAPYLKQQKMPLTIYPLRVCLVGILIFALGSLTLFAWVIFAIPASVGWHLLSIPFSFIALLLVTWPTAAILALVTPRFRDLQHALGIGLQALWFASPVYFTEKMFRDGGLGALVDMNPIYHLLELFRDPLLNGRWPDSYHLLWWGWTTLGLCAFAAILHSKLGRRTVFYL